MMALIVMDTVDQEDEKETFIDKDDEEDTTHEPRNTKKFFGPFGNTGLDENTV